MPESREFDDFIWESQTDRLVLSPRRGGRLLSWMHRGRELVCPLLKLEGGLVRFLFGEERYPGANYVVTHNVVCREARPDGFTIHLRHFWNTPNALMRAFGWPEKATRFHLDGLLLDKIVSFDPATRCLVLDMSVQNVSGETKYLSPWLHNALAPWATERFMVEDGESVPYKEKDIYWGSHPAHLGKPLRCVMGDGRGELFAVLGASTELLAGMYAAPAPKILPPGTFAQAPFELRYETLDLRPGQRWRANAFIAVTSDWRQWATASPVNLYCRVQDAAQGRWDISEAIRTLRTWALPQEQQKGLMVLSFLDKPPFSFAERFDAANGFAGFHQRGDSTEAHVVLVAFEHFGTLRAELSGPAQWQLVDASGTARRSLSLALAEDEARKLVLRGPADLAGKNSVSVRLSANGNGLLALSVDPKAAVEREYAYQLKELPEYLEERWKDQAQGFQGRTVEEFLQWQRVMRDRLRRHVLAGITDPCPLEPRMVERQVGATCVREKVLVQTEPGFWIPGYVIYSKNARGRMPVIIFYHGSGPGKQNFAPDEDPTFPRSEPGHEMEYIPYRLAHELGCLLYAPDLRGLGELAESNPLQYAGRIRALDIDYAALMAWDLLCEVDYLCSRDDADPTRIGAFGCSGGGGATASIAALDERITAAIASSTASYHRVRTAVPEGFFNRMRLPDKGPLPGVGHPAPTVDLCKLIAPRPLWIMDGKEDLPPPLASTAEAGRREIGEVYALLGASDRYIASWMEGGHCAGMTFANISGWFKRWLRL